MNEYLEQFEREDKPILVEIEGATIEVVKGSKGDKGEKGERGEQGEKGERGNDGFQGERGFQGLRGEQGERGERGFQGEQGEKGIDGKDGLNGKDGSPDTGLEIVEKINELPTNEDKYLIDIEHIDGLLKELKELRQLATQVTYTGGGGGKGHIKPYDLSSQLNGVLKTFNLPANWTVISVVSASFPNAFRPIIDYTFTPTSITFTSEINEAATLASGQSIIVIYEEA